MSNKTENRGEWTGQTIVGVPFEPAAHRMRSLVLEGAERTEAPSLAVTRDVFKVRMAANEGHRSSASLLINRMYSWRGYDTSTTLTQPPNAVTLLASAGDVTIGTITLNFDSPIGLPADEVYRDKIDELRNASRKLCEPTKLAIDQNVRSKRVVASLFNISYIYARNIMGYTDFILEVNPRHAAFYQKMLGAIIIGEERTCARVNAPAVLLRLDIAHMTAQIIKYGGLLQQAVGEKSLYPYFFSKKDEEGITQRLISRK